MSEFEISIKEIEAGGKALSLMISQAWLAECTLEYGFAPNPEGGQAFFRGTATKTGKDILVQGSLHAPMSAPCYRCLEPANIDIDSELTVLFSPQAPPYAQAQSNSISDDTDRGQKPTHKADRVVSDLGEKELSTETHDGHRIVLDSCLREHLLLEWPMQPLCKTDCPGIEIPGSIRGDKSWDRAVENKTPDPRFAKLRNFSLDKEQ